MTRDEAQKAKNEISRKFIDACETKPIIEEIPQICNNCEHYEKLFNRCFHEQVGENIDIFDPMVFGCNQFEKGMFL